MCNISHLFRNSQEIDAFRAVIQKYQVWAANLTPMNILDFARSTENALSGEAMRQHLLNYRVDHLRREGVLEISEEELRRQKAEVNLQRALAKRRQKEEEEIKAAKQAAADNEDIAEESDNNDSE